MCVCILYEWIMDVSVGRPVARDFSYRNEWRFINIIIIIIGRTCVWANYYALPSCTHSHTHTLYTRYIYIYYCVWSIHPGNVTERGCCRRPNDRWTAIRRRNLCIYILTSFVRLSAAVDDPRAHRHFLHYINSTRYKSKKDPNIITHK